MTHLFLFNKLFSILNLFFIFLLFDSSIEQPIITESKLEFGSSVFSKSCSVCHIGGENLILPEKNLHKEALDINGLSSYSSIFYQITNGKNGMPAFGGRLSPEEIDAVTIFVLDQSFYEKSF